MSSGRRSFHKSPWHYSGRNGKKYHLSDMVWEQGVLIGKDEKDSILIGQRDIMVAKAIEFPGTEGQPDSKLLLPSVTDEDIIML